MPDRFLILSRTANPAALRLQGILSQLGRAEIIVDHEPGQPAENVVWFDEDRSLPVCANVPHGAWSRAIRHAFVTGGEDENVWFVEDDVAGSLEAFSHLVRLVNQANPDLAAMDCRSMADDPKWYHWRQAAGYERPHRSFNPLCRLSPALLGHLRVSSPCYHEVWFASEAAGHGLKVLDMAGWLGSFRWRPLVAEPCAGVCHPVKDDAVHRRICFGEARA